MHYSEASCFCAPCGRSRIHRVSLCDWTALHLAARYQSILCKCNNHGSSLDRYL